MQRTLRNRRRGGAEPPAVPAVEKEALIAGFQAARQEAVRVGEKLREKEKELEEEKKKTRKLEEKAAAAEAANEKLKEKINRLERQNGLMTFGLTRVAEFVACVMEDAADES